MRTPEDVKFILARTWEDIKANPPRGPLLVEREPSAPAATCARGHSDWVQRKGRRRCRACDRQGQRERRGRR